MHPQTGSSDSYEKDIATEFLGRATQIHIYPLSFEEYYSFVGGAAHSALEQHMLCGGMPRITALTDNREKKAYLRDLYAELYIKDAFLVDMARRYDIKGKTYCNYPNKYYYTDFGLRNARLNYRQYDPGHIMENIIYMDLIRRGYSVDVGAVTERKTAKKPQLFVSLTAERLTFMEKLSIII